MQPTSCRECIQPASLESRKCRECGLLFRESPVDCSGERFRIGDRSYGALSVFGTGIAAAGIVAAIGGYPVVGAGFVLFGGGMLLADMAGK